MGPLDAERRPGGDRTALDSSSLGCDTPSVAVAAATIQPAGIADTTSTEIMSGDEADRLAQLETVVDVAIQSVIEAGTALAEIRDRRLYRATHDTFEAFVLDRWGFSARRARQLVAAADIVAAIPSGTAVPQSERAIRELSPLRHHEDRLAEALSIAAADPRGITSHSVCEAVVIVLRRVEFIDALKEMFPELTANFDHELLTEIVTVQMAAEDLYRTGWMRPAPPWWAGDVAFDVAVQNRVSEFVDWCDAVGIGDDTFDRFLIDGPDAVTSVVDDAALGDWWHGGTTEERRDAALGHWFMWQTSATQPAVHRDLPVFGGAR